MHDPHEEKMILGHDPVPGYRPVFLVAIALGLVYLGFILLTTWGQAPAAH